MFTRLLLNKSLVFASLMILTIMLSLTYLSGGVTAESKSGHEVLFSVPMGESLDSTLQYSHKRDEELQWGPKALAAAPDGSFVIANTVSNNLLRFDAKGNLLNTVDLSQIAVGVADLEATRAGIFALDVAASTPVVLHIDYAGYLLAKYEVPAEVREWLSGLAVGENGQLLLEHKAEIAYQLLDADGALDAFPVDGLSSRSVPIKPQGSTAEQASRAGINAGSNRIEIAVPNTLAGVRLLGTGAGGSFYVIVNELVVDQAYTFRLDQVVHHYSLDGKLLGLARFPLGEQFTEVDHPYAIGASGELYALLTRSDSVAVVKLRFQGELAPILPGQPKLTAQQPADAQKGGSDAPQCAIWRTTMYDNAYYYINNSKYLNATNISGACNGRGKPRYLGGAGTYGSVAYDWGGWDTVAGYNSLLNSNYKAGDIDVYNPWPYGVESCSVGVDCSGYVTRVWGRTDQKYSTNTLPNISYALAGYWETFQGDIMNKPNDHVRLIHWRDGNGAGVWEATIDAGYDRAISRYLYWDRFNGYTARRYNLVCYYP